MIVGRVNAAREGIVRVRVGRASDAYREIDAVIDTGFNDELTLPMELIDELGLSYAAPTKATLAGGQVVEVDYFRATIAWDGQERAALVLELSGTPLLGMGLLDGHRLTLDAVPAGHITIERLSQA